MVNGDTGGVTTEDAALKVDRMYAVAVRDGADLFLWIRIRRPAAGDIYYMFPTGREDDEWKSWNPHGSYHKDGRLHHKSFDRKMFAQELQKPDASFKGTLRMVERPIAASEPRAFGVICEPTKFAQVMEIGVGSLSEKKYETSISVDLTEPGVKPVLGPGEVVQQQKFVDEIPWIVVSLQRCAIPSGL